MKGYLKRDPKLFQLEPKVTTIGREGCNIVIQAILQATSSVNQQHALIEYRTDEDCFILQDLNSGQGSYVNERRVENSYYQLEKGDMLRFGDSSDTYELVVEHDEERYDMVERPKDLSERRVIYHRTVFPETSPLEINISQSYGGDKQAGGQPISRTLPRKKSSSRSPRRQSSERPAGSLRETNSARPNGCRNTSISLSDDSEPSDTEIMSGINKLVYGRMKRRMRMQNLEALLSTNDSITKDLEQLTIYLSDIVTDMVTHGFHSDGLNVKIKTLASATPCESASHLYRVLIQMLAAQSHWLAQLEAALRECAVDYHEASTEGPWVHIRKMAASWRSADEEVAQLKVRLDEMEAIFEKEAMDKQTSLDLLQSELRQEFEEKIETIKRDYEEAKRVDTDEVESRLRNEFSEDIQRKNDQIAEITKELDELRISEASLQAIISNITEQSTRTTEMNRIAETHELEKKERREDLDQLNKRLETAEARFKHDLKNQKKEVKTKISKLEMQLNETVTKNKDQNAQINSLKLTISGSERQKTQQDQNNMRRLEEARRELNKKNNIIAELKRDLSDAHRKLSDCLMENQETVYQPAAVSNGDNCSLPRVRTPHPPGPPQGYRYTIRVRR